MRTVNMKEPTRGVQAKANIKINCQKMWNRCFHEQGLLIIHPSPVFDSALSEIQFPRLEDKLLSVCLPKHLYCVRWQRSSFSPFLSWLIAFAPSGFRALSRVWNLVKNLYSLSFCLSWIRFWSLNLFVGWSTTAFLKEGRASRVESLHELERIVF